MSDRTNIDFFKHYKSDLFKTTNKYCTITKTRKGDGIVYGSLIIPYNEKGIHEWKLKISSKIQACTVGISEPPAIFSGKGNVHYGYCNNGKRRGPNGIQDNFYEPYKGDIISIVLDLSQRTKQLSFKKNNGALKKAFNIARTSVGYSLAVYIGYNDNAYSTVQLMSYTYINKSSKTEWKNRRKQVKVESNYKWQPRDNEMYHTSMDDVFIENEQLKQKIDDLYFENDELNENVDMFQNQIDNLLFEKSRLQQLADEKHYELADKCDQQAIIIQKMGIQIADLIAENNGLKAVNCKIKKEYELKINELMEMNNGNVINYKQWDANKILLWIMSLDNGRYSKYKKSVCKSLVEEGICGDDLDKVDGTDIKGWGIVNFKDKKYLQQKIKDLIKYRNKNNDEGYYQEQTEQM